MADPQGLDEEFALAVRELALVFVRHRGTTLGQRHQVGPSDAAALARLHVKGPQTPGELAAWLGLSTGAVTELLDRLEAAGHAVRTRHPTDRRKVLVSLTEEAREVIVNQVLAPLVRTLRPVLSGYEAVTQAQIVDALRAATAALERVGTGSAGES